MEIAFSLQRFLDSTMFDILVIISAVVAATGYLLLREKLALTKNRILLVVALLPLIVLNALRLAG